MLNALSKSELANFLELSENDVELLWRSGELKKSDDPTSRSLPQLMNSTVADLIEYFLSSTDLPYSISKYEAEQWTILACDCWDSLGENLCFDKLFVEIFLASRDICDDQTSDHREKISMIICLIVTAFADGGNVHNSIIYEGGSRAY